MRVFGRNEMANADACFTNVMTIDGDRSKAALLQQIFRLPASELLTAA